MKTTVLFLTAVVFCTGAVAAPLDRFSITAEEHAACDDDAMNLCAFTYPSVDHLLGCMKTNRSKLSAVCEAAFVSGLKRRHIPL